MIALACAKPPPKKQPTQFTRSFRRRFIQDKKSIIAKMKENMTTLEQKLDDMIAREEKIFRSVDIEVIEPDIIIRDVEDDDLWI